MECLEHSGQAWLDVVSSDSEQLAGCCGKRRGGGVSVVTFRVHGKREWGNLLTFSHFLSCPSCLPGPVGVFRWYHCEVWDLGHCRTGAIPQSGSHVLPWGSGCHRGLWHHQAGTGYTQLFSNYLCVICPYVALHKYCCCSRSSDIHGLVITFLYLIVMMLLEHCSCACICQHCGATLPTSWFINSYIDVLIHARLPSAF